MIKYEDLIKYHLHYVNCYIDDSKIERGLIYIFEKKDAFILQNKRYGACIGGGILKKYGFTCSWYVDFCVKEIEILGLYGQLNQWWWN